jgi:antirestriction protein
MIKIAITNLGKYNEGELLYEWVELPCDDFAEVLELIGNPEEYFISDYECESLDVKIHEYADLDQLNELAETLSLLHSYELKIIRAIAEANSGSTIEEALEIFKNDNYVYYDEKCLEDLAISLVEFNYFGEIPKEIEYYIDYKKFARDLHYSGYIETSYGIIFFC